jgi:hypothetical protein
MSKTQIETKENDMNYKLVFIINAVVLVAFGLLLVVAPVTGLKQFGMTTRVLEIFLTRIVGAALTALGLVLWFAQNVDEETQRWIGIAALAGAVLGLIVMLIGAFGSLIRGMGWVALLVLVLFAAGYAFLIFLQPKMQQ